MDVGKILLTLSYVKYKQFDFSLLVNGKSIERKVHFPELLGVLFQLEPKVKGMFLFRIYKFFWLYNRVHGEGEGK